MGSLRIMGWISILVAMAILGMGGAPIAEKFGVTWLVFVLKWIAYVSVGLVAVATLVIGGLGMHHGILTLLGKDVSTLSSSSPERRLSGTPRVEGPGEETADAVDTGT